jgi:uncharacterized protein (DUF4415 family)
VKTKPASDAPVWSDPDDAPTLTKPFFARAEIRDGEKLVRPARARSRRAGRAVTLRLDPDVVEALQAGGADWPARANAALRAAFAKTN